MAEAPLPQHTLAAELPAQAYPRQALADKPTCLAAYPWSGCTHHLKRRSHDNQAQTHHLKPLQATALIYMSNDIYVEGWGFKTTQTALVWRAMAEQDFTDTDTDVMSRKTNLILN